MQNLFVSGCHRVPAERRLQSNRHRWRSRVLVSPRDSQALPEKSGTARRCLERVAQWTSLGLLAIGGVAAAARGQDFSQIWRRRGRYLTVVGDCASCHTKPGGRDFAGGLPVEAPFGKVVAPNITPDSHSGIGLWDADDFVRAITTGVRRDGAHLFPAMPYTYYTKVRREDVRAIRAYLSTLPAVSNTVAADRLPFPLSVRADMAAWNVLYLLRSGRVPPRSRQERRMGSRRLSRRRS